MNQVKTGTIAGLFVLLFGILALPSGLWGQIQEISNATATPIHGAGHDYIRMLGETINPANGSVSLHIEIPVPPGRQLNLPLSFNYDSLGIYTWTVADNIGARITNGLGGWSDSTPLLTSVHNSIPALDPNQGTCEYDTSFVFTDKSGDRHLLGILAVSTTNQCLRLGIT